MLYGFDDRLSPVGAVSSKEMSKCVVNTFFPVLGSLPAPRDTALGGSSRETCARGSADRRLYEDAIFTSSTVGRHGGGETPVRDPEDPRPAGNLLFSGDRRNSARPACAARRASSSCRFRKRRRANSSRSPHGRGPERSREWCHDGGGLIAVVPLGPGAVRPCPSSSCRSLAKADRACRMLRTPGTLTSTTAGSCDVCI